MQRHVNKSIPVDKNQNFLLDEDFIKWRLFRTEEQNAQWAKYIDENPHLEQSIHEAIVQFSALQMNKRSLPQAEKDALYTTLMRNIKRKRKRKVFLQYVSSVAAVLVIAIVSVLYMQQHKSNSLLKSIDNNTIIGQTLMEEEVYIISGEHKTNLTNNSELKFTHDENVVITDSTKSQQELKLASASMNKLVVPYGKRSNLILADGTRVFLNSGTQVDFPTKFIGSTREITVNGEVYVEVKKDTSKPFIIHTNSMNIEVYGTSFNVSDYDDDLTKTVVLVEGSIGVNTADKETKLKPNRKLEITNGKITEETVDVSEYICWTKGIMEFNETPVSEILKKVGRYYNVEFENSPDISLNDKTYSGKLFLSNNLDSVMVSISLLSSTKYNREDNIIHISKK